MITYCDKNRKGRAAVFTINANENEESHARTFQIVTANIPCNEQNCEHEKSLYIFDDQNGFFWVRECALVSSTFCPLVQHDKATDIRNAVIGQGLKSTLCNFHGLKMPYGPT